MWQRAAALIVGFLLIFSAVARAELPLPVEVATPRVLVRAEAGLEKQAARAAERADHHLARIQTDLAGLPRPARIEIRLVKRMGSLRDAVPPGWGAPEWAQGVAYPRHDLIVIAARDRQNGVHDIDSTLAHELAHVALERALGDGVATRWLTEGFAYLHSSDFSLARTQTLFGAVVGRKLVPLWQLERTFPAHEDAAALAYAQSYDFLAWLAHRGRHVDRHDDGDRFALRQFFAELADKKSYDQAAMAAFGRPLVDLEKEWLDSIRDRYLWQPVGLGGLALWGFAALLLVLGFLRKRRLGRARMRQWELEEELARRQAEELADPVRWN